MILFDMNLKEIEAEAFEKEKLWQSAASVHIKSLQEALNVKTQLYDELHKNFSQLKEDFKYNLKLLLGRDNELKDMDSVHITLKTNVNKHLYDLSDLHIQIDNLKTKLNEEKKSKKDVETYYKQLLNDQQIKFDIFRISKKKELKDLMNSFEKVKTQLQQENNQFKFQIEAQKCDLENEFENFIRSKEKEQKDQQEKIENELLVGEMKNKLLSKEINVFQKKETELNELLESKNKKIKELQNLLQQTNWELSDMSSSKNTRILELEAQIKYVMQSSEQIKKEFSEKNMQFDKEIRLKEANLISSKQTLLDREKRYEEDIRDLKNKVEMSNAEVKRALLDKNSIETDLNEKLYKNEIYIKELQKKLEELDFINNNSLLKKKNEIFLLKEHKELLLAENNQLKKDCKELQEENSNLVKQKESSTRNLVQPKLDKQFKKETEMNFQEKNEKLKMIIKQMSSEMEELKEIKKQLSADISQSVKYDDNYVKSLEKDVIKYKQELRRIKEEQVASHKDLVTNELKSDIMVSNHHPQIQNHMQMLCNTIGKLEGEKLDMRAQLQKLQAKLDHQLNIRQEQEKDSQLLLSKFQQLDMEFTASRHQAKQEIKKLRNEISNLTLQLFESQQEAHEYYRGGIHNNMRAIELNEKVSQLTVDMAADTPWLSNPIQAKLVQTLQDKIATLQKQLLSKNQHLTSGLSSENPELKLLQTKLKAVSRERNMLLESSNKMRAELNQIKGMQEEKDEKHLVSQKPIEKGLKKLEELQYELTRKQLAFAQRCSPIESKRTSSTNADDINRNSTDCLKLSKEKLSSTQVPDSQVDDKLMISSVDDSSIKDIWKILNQEPSSPSNNEGSEPIKLVSANDVKNSAHVTSVRRKKKPKIRNYNIRD